VQCAGANGIGGGWEGGRGGESSYVLRDKAL